MCWRAIAVQTDSLSLASELNQSECPKKNLGPRKPAAPTLPHCRGMAHIRWSKLGIRCLLPKAQAQAAGGLRTARVAGMLPPRGGLPEDARRPHLPRGRQTQESAKYAGTHSRKTLGPRVCLDLWYGRGVMLFFGHFSFSGSVSLAQVTLPCSLRSQAFVRFNILDIDTGREG